MALYKCNVLSLANQRIENASKINEAIKSGQSEVAKSYKDAVVFLTGGSGFLGKALIEKLLRSCQIKKLYLLLRPAGNKNVQERLSSIIQDYLYDWLRENKPDFMDKIIPVFGDITKIGLGIDEQMMTTLISEVNIIIHGAATINFTEPLKNATLTNVRGAREMLRFGKTCQNLKAFIHISTAYVHATEKTSQQYLPEQFLSPPIKPDLLIQMSEELDDETLELITPKALEDSPNTYSLTKAAAEELVRLNSDGLPLCIVRPAIVIGMYDEHPGWMDRSVMNGGLGFIAGATIGALHTMYGDEDKTTDMVPLDFVTNATIISGHETIQRRKRDETDIKIYTVSSTRNPLTTGYFKSFLFTPEMLTLVSPKVVWYPFVKITTSKVLFTIITWLLHLFPAYLADFILKLLGKKQKAVRLLSKAYKQNKIYGIYMCNSWKFGDINLVEMFKRQTQVDQLIYNCEITSVTCKDLLSMNAYGVKKYIFKDNFTEEEVKLARKKMFWLFIANIFYLLAYTYLIWKVFVTVFNLFLIFLW